MPLTIEFLGTGTSGGVPMIACNCAICRSDDPRDKRLRSSVMLSTPSTRVVIDTTPDFRFQMLRSKVQHLDAVLFTHSHKDHIAGLDDIRAFNFFMQRPIALYANDETGDALKRDFYYAFAEKKYPGIPEIDLHIIHDDLFSIGEIHFQPIRVRHLHMEVIGYRTGAFTYITDANHIDERQKDRIRGSEVLVINALRKEKHISHFTLEEAIGLARELEIPRTYFTHISHQMGFHDEVERSLPEGMHLAYDGLVLQL